MLDGDLAWALATAIHYEWDEREQELLAPLIDATIMRVECERIEEIARPLIEALWGNMKPLVEETLVDQAKRSDFVADALEDALADLELGPLRSRLGVDVLAQAAVDLAGHGFFLEDCLDCIEDGLGHAPPDRHPGLVARAAAALALRGAPDFGAERPDDHERHEARIRVLSMAELGLESLPRLASALRAFAGEPLPPLREDAVLQAVMQRRLAGMAELN